MTALGTNDVRLFPVPSACAPNPADVVLTNPRAPCEIPFFDAVYPGPSARLQPQQSVLAFVFTPTPTPPPTPRRRAQPTGGGGMPPLLLRRMHIEEIAPPEAGVKRAVAPKAAKTVMAPVDEKHVAAPAVAARSLEAPPTVKGVQAPGGEKRVTAIQNPRRLPRRR